MESYFNVQTIVNYMAINRRGFLKGFFSVSLNKLTNDSEDKKQEGHEEVRTPYCYELAHSDLTFAEEYLKGLIEKKFNGPHLTYESNINSATTFIHIGVWDQLPLEDEVRKCYIPLLKKARDSIDLYDPAEIKKHDPEGTKNNSDYPTSAMHTKACIQARIYNLENYCNNEIGDSEDSYERVKKEGKYKFIED